MPQQKRHLAVATPPALPQGSGPLADFLLARWKESQGRERLRQRQQQWAAS